MTLTENQKLFEKYLLNLPRYKKKELRALYNNAVNTNRFNEEQFEELAQAIEDEMRERFPTEAKRIFGGMDTVHRKYLKQLLQEATSTFNTSINKHKTKVKCGAGVFKGSKLIDVYISFMLSNKAKCWVFIQQIDNKSPTTLTVKEIFGENLNERRFEFNDVLHGNEISSWLFEVMGKIGFEKIAKT